MKYYFGLTKELRHQREGKKLTFFAPLFSAAWRRTIKQRKPLLDLNIGGRHFSRPLFPKTANELF